MKIKGLVISYFFPPINSSEGNVTFKLINRSNFDYDIFSLNSITPWSYGNNNFLFNDKFKIIKNNSFDLKSFKKMGLNYFCKNKKIKYDFIMSRSMPVESHEIALKIKKKNPNILWVSSFGDPIANNPYELFAYKYNLNKNLNYLKIYQLIKYIIKNILIKFFYYIKNKNLIKIQEKIFKNANILIFNNIEQSLYMLGDNYDKYKNKVLILPHSYSEELFKSEYETLLKIKKRKNKKKLIKILYAGHTDDIRTLKYFLYAIEEKKEILKNKIIFKIIGTLPKNEINYISKMKLDNLVVFNKNKNYYDSLEEMINSDLLIHIDALFPDFLMKKNIFFAAKIADYLGSKTKILGLSTDGISKKILEETNNYCICNNKTIILNFLYDLINKQINLSKNNINNDNIKKYESKKIAKLFDNKIKEELKK